MRIHGGCVNVGLKFFRVEKEMILLPKWNKVYRHLNKFRWFFQILSWVSDVCPTNVQWLSDDYLMTAWWLSYDRPMTVWWLSYDRPMTFWWLSKKKKSDNYLHLRLANTALHGFLLCREGSLIQSSGPMCTRSRCENCLAKSSKAIQNSPSFRTYFWKK